MERLSKEEKEHVIKDKKMVSDNFITDLMGNTEGLALQTIKSIKNIVYQKCQLQEIFLFGKTGF